MLPTEEKIYPAEQSQPPISSPKEKIPYSGNSLASVRSAVCCAWREQYEPALNVLSCCGWDCITLLPTDCLHCILECCWASRQAQTEKEMEIFEERVLSGANIIIIAMPVAVAVTSSYFITNTQGKQGKGGWT